MTRRKFFSFLPALAALPAVCKIVAETKAWEGTRVPRGGDAWRELEASEKRMKEATGEFKPFIASYRFPFKSSYPNHKIAGISA